MKVARGRILSAFVDDDGSDGEGGELLHSANVRGDIARCVGSVLLASRWQSGAGESGRRSATGPRWKNVRLAWSRSDPAAGTGRRIGA